MSLCNLNNSTIWSAFSSDWRWEQSCSCGQVTGWGWNCWHQRCGPLWFPTRSNLPGERFAQDAEACSEKVSLCCSAGELNVFQSVSYWATKFAKTWQDDEVHSVLLMCVLCGVTSFLNTDSLWMKTWGEVAYWSEQKLRQYIRYCCDVMSRDSVCFCPPEVQGPKQAVHPALPPRLRCADTGNAL